MCLDGRMPIEVGSLLGEAGQAFGVGVLFSAFLFGFRHGIDWDHIAAITDITSTQDDRRSSVFFGTLYALGHALVVFVIGSVAIVLGQRLPDSVDEAMGRIVGVTLVVLGVYVIVGVVRHGREFRMRSRWMLIFAGANRAYRRIRPDRREVHDQEPVHVHSGESSSVAVAADIPVSEWHHGHHGRPGHHHHKHPEPDERFANYGRGTAFSVGMVHGIGAETPTQILIFLTAAGAGGKLVGEAVLLTFIVGLLASNSLITLGSATGFLRASENWRLYITIALLTAGFSLVIGVLFITGKGSLLPALFGG
jgi:ABC-type nickel/cobalt efflux system permease component RcnA